MTDSFVLDSKAVDLSLRRMAHEILEKNQGKALALVGLHSRGVPLAKRLAVMLQEYDRKRKGKIPVGQLDTSFHRDDIENVISVPKKTEINFNVDDYVVILVDDVIFTGRTIRAALNAMVDIGRTQSIQLAVLIDRGHRQLPIQPDYTGKEILTHPQDYICVKLKEIDEIDEARLRKEK